MDRLRALFRLTYFTFSISYYLVRYLVKVPFHGHDLSRGIRLRRAFFTSLMPVLGVNILQKGKAPTKPGFYVCNHRSYFDPLVKLTRINALPVAKKEVKSWPLIGVGLQLSGVFFVDREDPDNRRKIRKELGEIFKQGFGILLYPEGTTHVEPSTLEFKMGAFKEAVAVGAPVFPIAIAYPEKEDAWIGDDTFFRHFFARFGQKTLSIKLSFGPALVMDDPADLRDAARLWIDKELCKIQRSWSTLEIAT